MNFFEDLLACAGAWEGHSRLQVSQDDPAEECRTRLSVTPMLHDSFVRLDQAWQWKNQPQAGTMLIGYEPKGGVATAYWADTWHNGRKVMVLTGGFEPQRGLVLRGRFSAGSGPEWGWRIQMQTAAGRLKLDMCCVEPSGRDSGGAWAEFGPAPHGSN